MLQFLVLLCIYSFYCVFNWVGISRLKVDNRVKSPCIGVCSTGIGDSVCRGCKRFMHEIIRWNAYREDEKQAVVDRLDALLAQVVKARVQIIDEVKLRTQIEQHKIRFNKKANIYCWVFDLLKAGAGHITNLHDYGCEVRAEFIQLSLIQLRDAIDEDYFELSLAHHERYFK